MPKPKHEILARILGEHEFRIKRLSPKRLQQVQEAYLNDFRASLLPKPKKPLRDNKEEKYKKLKEEFLREYREITENAT